VGSLDDEGVFIADWGVCTFASFRAAALIMVFPVVDLFVLASPGHMATHLRGVPFRRLAATAYSLTLAYCDLQYSLPEPVSSAENVHGSISMILWPFLSEMEYSLYI
jgi:hypothetical protein